MSRLSPEVERKLKGLSRFYRYDPPEERNWKSVWFFDNGRGVMINSGPDFKCNMHSENRFECCVLKGYPDRYDIDFTTALINGIFDEITDEDALYYAQCVAALPKPVNTRESGLEMFLHDAETLLE